VLSNKFGSEQNEFGPNSIAFFLAGWLPRWAGYKYSLSGKPDFFEGAPGVPQSLVQTGTKQINCSTFTFAALGCLYPRNVFDLDWYKVHNLWAPFSQFDNVEYCFERGILGPISNEIGDECGWYLVQAWNESFTSGHSFFVWKAQSGYRLLEASGRNPEWGAIIWRNMGSATSGEPLDRWASLESLKLKSRIRAGRLL